MRRVFVLLCSVALAGLTAVGATPAGASMSVDVNPSTAPILGWGFLEETVPGSGDFELGPGTPPDGVGSARITTGANGGMAFGMIGYGGTRLDEITSLGYSTYRSSVDAGNNLAASMQMPIDYDVTDANTSYQGRIVFSPSDTSPGGVLQDTWQAWDAYAGRWYATAAPGNIACPSSSRCTWTELLTAFPDAGIHGSPFYGGVLFKAGAWSSAFDGNVDAFSITTTANGTDSYDFEPLTTTACYVPHAQDLIGVRYRSFGNTGSNEVYAGVPDLGATPRAEAGLTWASGDNTFSITYGPATGLSTTVNAGTPLTRSIAQITSDMSAKGKTLTLGDLNIMQITVKNQSNVVGPQPSVVVKDLTVDGVPIDADTTTPATIDDLAGVSGVTRDWMLTGLDFVDGFTVTGKVWLDPGSGFGASAEGSRVEFGVGHYDDTVTIDVGDASAPETLGSTADVAFSATGTRLRPVEFLISTADATATAGLDYTSTVVPVVFQPCSSGSDVVSIPVLPDALIEGTETFSVNATQALGATIGDGTGTVSILDNDGFRISDLSVAEGDTDARTVVKFSVNLSQAQPTVTTVNYATVGGSATPGYDYGHKGPKTLKFKAGQTTKPVTIKILDDVAPESDETFSVVLSGSSGPLIVDGTGVATIRDDDSPTAAVPELRVSDASVWEGDIGTKNKVWVTISLSSASLGVVTVSTATADGTATVAGSDYKAKSPKVITFKPGQTSRRVGITYYPDTSVEGDETFDFVLSSPSGAPIADAIGTVTLRNED